MVLKNTYARAFASEYFASSLQLYLKKDSDTVAAMRILVKFLKQLLL